MSREISKRKRRVVVGSLFVTVFALAGTADAATRTTTKARKRVSVAKGRPTRTTASNARQAAPGGGPNSSAQIAVTSTTRSEGSGAVRPTTTVPAGGYVLSFTDSIVETGLSGFRAEIKQTLDNDKGLRGIQWLESLDVPCSFQTLTRTLDGTQEYSGRSWINCGNSPIFSTTKVEFTAERNFVRGLAVCDSRQNSNHRIKGIRLFGAKVWLTKQQIDHLDGSIETTRSNCGDWAPAVFCPNGMIATGLIVREAFDGSAVSGPAHAGEGLALQCQRVEWR